MTGKPQVTNRMRRVVISESREQFRNSHPEGGSEHVKIAKADFLLPVLQIGDEATIHAYVLSHVDLRPLSPLPQAAQPLAESDTDISGHAPNYGCRLSPINRL